MSKGKRKGKGERKYTMSPKALAQRRAAAWKHGERAATALSQAMPPCKRSICPMNEPDEKHNCAVKRQVEAAGGAVDRCPVQIAVNPELRARFVEAIRKGEYEGLAEFTGTLLAGMGELSAQELGRVMDEGLAIDFSTFGPDGEVATGKKTNPRAEPLIKLLEMVGATATQQAITPKSRGEQKRDQGLSELADLLTRRAAITAGT